MSIGAAASLLPTSKRPIPLRARPDLVMQRILYGDQANWVIKDPVSLKYHRLLESQYCVLQTLDGSRSLEDLRDELRRQFPTLHVGLADVQAVVTDLHQKGLVASNRPGQAATLIERYREERWQKIKNTLRSFLYLKVPGWDPERTLAWLYPFVRWMFRPTVAFLCIALVVSSWVLLAVQFDRFHRTMPEFKQFFGWPNLLYLWLTLGAAKILHEFGHGLACKHFGSECHEMGVMLLVFSPCLYCDATDSWMLPNKWHRIIIGSAGMYVEVILSAIAIFVWWNTESGLLHHLCFNVFLVTTITTVIFNANPLMRFDGYYMFSDWVEIPNLRAKATKMFLDKFGWYCLGIEPRPDPFQPETGRNWLAAYAVAAAVYRWFILFAILLFLYTFLKPYHLQSVGIILAVCSVVAIVGTMVVGVYQLIKAPRSEPMSYRKIAATVSVVGLLVAAALSIRFPLHAEAPFLVEPEQGKEVMVVTPGRLVEVRVHPGDPVKRGQVLAVLENPEIAERIRELQVEREKAGQRIKMYRGLQDTGGEQVARQRIAGIDAQLKELQKQKDHLQLQAPCDGTVVAAPYVPEKASDEPNGPLPRWHGDPLDPRNRGCYLERRTQLLTVAPSQRLVAVAYVDQAQRNELTAGQEVELKFDHMPGEVFHSRVESISRQDREFAPPDLSNKLGGELATVTDASGRERLVSRAYPASIPLEGDRALFRAGMRGRARILLERRSGAAWVWRYLRQTFQFRL